MTQSFAGLLKKPRPSSFDALIHELDFGEGANWQVGGSLKAFMQPTSCHCLVSEMIRNASQLWTMPEAFSQWGFGSLSDRRDGDVSDSVITGFALDCLS